MPDLFAGPKLLANANLIAIPSTRLFGLYGVRFGRLQCGTLFIA
jgi:hypothetical protein